MNDDYTGPQQMPKDQDPELVPQGGHDVDSFLPTEFTLDPATIADLERALEELETYDTSKPSDDMTDWCDLQVDQAKSDDAINKLNAGAGWSTIDDPDVKPFETHEEREKRKRDKRLEDVDYSGPAKRFEEIGKKGLTDKEKADIINNIIWSEDL